MLRSSEYAALTDRQLVNKLAQMSKQSGKAAVILNAIVNDDWYHAVTELRHRHQLESAKVSCVNEDAITRTGRMACATTIEIDPVRFKSYFADRRIRLVQVSEMAGCCRDWASIVACKRKLSFSKADRIATELGVQVDDFIFAVGTDRERERVGLL